VANRSRSLALSTRALAVDKGSRSGRYAQSVAALRRCFRLLSNSPSSVTLQTHASKYLLYIFRRNDLIGLQAAPHPGRPCPAPTKCPYVLHHSIKPLDTNTSKGSTFKMIDPMFSSFSQPQPCIQVLMPLDLSWPTRRSVCLTRAICPMGWLKCY
jgi:hypothetical protein